VICPQITHIMLPICPQMADREKGARRQRRNREEEDATSGCEDVARDPTMKRIPTKEGEELRK